MRATRVLLETLFRPKVISDYQRTRVESERFKWRVFNVLTWVATLGAGAFVALFQDFGGDAQGNHALLPIRQSVRGWYERVIIGAPAATVVDAAGAAAPTAVVSQLPPSPPAAAAVAADKKPEQMR